MALMSSKERVTAAIEFKGPDRTPIFLGAPWDKLQSPTVAGNPAMYPNDYYHCPVGWYYEGELFGRNMDNWGCEWLNLQESGIGQVVGHPLGDINCLDSYIWPKAADNDMTLACEMSEKRGDKYFILGYISLFERMIHIRGFENTLMDIALEEDHFFTIRDKILQYDLDLIEMLLELNPDGIFIGDDWGSQISLLISPDSWRKYFLPAYKKMFDKIRNAGKHVFLHTDGYTMDILPDFVKAGANVFYIEFAVNGHKQVKEKLGGRVAFLNLPDTQITAFGTFDEIGNHIKELIDNFGSYNGGFISSYKLDDSEKGKFILEKSKKYCNIY